MSKLASPYLMGWIGFKKLQGKVTVKQEKLSNI
jgi:hypothetical protein